MPGWVVGVVGTFALSAVSAYGFLRLRCKGTGHPFGPHARPWGIAVIAVTALVSTGLGVAAVAVSHHVRAAYIGLLVPSVLWLGQASARSSRERASMLARRLAACLTLPLGRLDDRMGDDLQDWCDARLRAVSGIPQWVSDAAQYYYRQVAGRLKNSRALAELTGWRESIEHKITIVRLIGLDTTSARLHAALRGHPSTIHMRRYSLADRPRLAARLESEAQNELRLFLACLYRMGYRRLLIYPIRAEGSTRARPGSRPLTGPGTRPASSPPASPPPASPPPASPPPASSPPASPAADQPAAD